jgi:glucose-6-phosphate isomerase
MQELLTLDIGHLLSKEPGPSRISALEFKEMLLRHATAFNDFQIGLQAGEYSITLPFEAADLIPQLKTIAKRLQAKYENILLIGIGGSALGAKAILQFLKGPYYNLEERAGRPRIFVLDNLDPALVSKLEELLDWQKTAIIYASKSGSTPETAANFMYFYQKYKEAGGDDRDLVFMCDPKDNGINRIAKNLGCILLPIPPKLGGRYSVLSTVGLLPAELAGIDSTRLLAGAEQMHQSILREPLAQNALFALGVCNFELAARGKAIHVLFNYSSLLTEFGLWFMQLWGESLGKKYSLTGETVHTGTTPLTCTGATDQHSLLQLFKEGPLDKLFGFIKINEWPNNLVIPSLFSTEKEYAYFAGHTLNEQLSIEQLSTEMSLVRAGNPCYLLTLRDLSPECLGALFYFYQALVVFSAKLWNINPFDQPGVEEGKNITYALMNREDYADRREQYLEEVAKYHQEGRVYTV